MRQWYVDTWRVYGVELFKRFTSLFNAGSDTWWMLLRIAGNLMDIEWDLDKIERWLDEDL
jgi:hypothetical protein